MAGFAFTVLIGIFLLPKDTGSRPREDLLLAAAVGPNVGAVLPYTANLLQQAAQGSTSITSSSGNKGGRQHEV